MNAIKQFINGSKEGVKNFSENISIIINSSLLSIVYLIGVGITKLIAKSQRKQFLELKQTEKESYWSELNIGKKPFKEYYRQF